MSNRRSRRAKRGHTDAAAGLAALLVLASLANGKAPAAHSEPELEREGVRLAAQLIALTGDGEGQQQVLVRVADRVPNTAELVAVLGSALRLITGTYVAALLDRTDELEAGHSDTTRQAFVEEALASLDRIAEMEMD